MIAKNLFLVKTENGQAYTEAWRQQTYKQSPLLVQISTTLFVLTDSVTYFQFQFPLLVCFYTMDEVQ